MFMSCRVARRVCLPFLFLSLQLASLVDDAALPGITAGLDLFSFRVRGVREREAYSRS